MSVSRRMLLLTGSAAVTVAGVTWAATRDPKAARAPWREAAAGFGDPRLDVLAYAILAPNPHNMQPWRIRLDGENALTVFCDHDRLLPETDPPNRQITIGFGAFLELLRQAAAERGFLAEITPFPEGQSHPALDDRPIAKVTLVQTDAVERDPLFGQVLLRRTNRAPFDTSKIPSADDLSAVVQTANSAVAAGFVAKPAMVEDLRALTIAAWRTEWALKRTREESINVTRIGKTENNTNPYGLSLAGAPMDAAAGLGLLTHEKMNEEGSTAYEQSLEFYEKACETASAYAWIKTASNTRIDQLESGRAWVRMQLAAATHGLGFHPLSQALQEFPEMAEHYARAHELLGAKEGETVQMLSRLGYATRKTPPAPREALISKLIPI
mgnify:CR=1 FL=1